MEVPAAIGDFSSSTRKLFIKPGPTGIVTMLLVAKDCEMVSWVSGFVVNVEGNSSTISLVPTIPTLYPVEITLTVAPPDCAETGTIEALGGPGNWVPLRASLLTGRPSPVP